MQPYVYPYIGYFQLIRAADQFVFLDDVNFIKKGWINRNYIYSSQGPQLFTIPLSGSSQNTLISQTKLFGDDWSKKTLKQIQQNYKKAPHFEEVFPILQNVFGAQHDTIAELAISSVSSVLAYLEIPFNPIKSSELELGPVTAQDRIIAICKTLQTERYINAAGGKELYSAAAFAEKNMDLFFIHSGKIEYSQFKTPNSQSYSIIDVLMFNDKRATITLLDQFELVRANI